MPKITLGIVGLHEILGRDYGIEELYWVLSYQFYEASCRSSLTFLEQRAKKVVSDSPGLVGFAPREVNLGSFLLGMCRWPLRQNPFPIIVYSVAIIDPILVTLGKKSNFCSPNLVTFCLCIYIIKPFNLVILKLTDAFVKLNVV